jgi:DNA polymerase-3 subunit epsilon
LLQSLGRPGCSGRRNCNANLDELRGDRPDLHCEPQQAGGIPCNLQLDETDVETSGFDPDLDRVLSVAALTVTAGGAIEHSTYSLLDPGVDPGPTNVHGLTPAMLAGQPCYADIAEHVATVLRGRVLVAHNAAFDYAFLAAEAHRCDAELPVASVLCTLELAGLLDLDLDSLSLAALARHWNITQARPHDALDDARVLAAVLPCVLARAAELEIALPIRGPATLPPVTFAAAA